MKKSFLIIASIATFLSAKAQTATWSIDPSHSKVGFSITHMMISDVEGYFKQVSATIKSTKADFTDASVEFTAQAGSIFTDSDQRDGHLKSPDFFDVAKFPTVSFKSTSFKKAKNGSYILKGDLSIHGITKPVTLTAVAKTAVNPMSKKTVAGFKITGKIKRSDYALGASMPAAMLSEEVVLNINAEFSKD